MHKDNIMQPLSAIRNTCPVSKGGHGVLENYVNSKVSCMQLGTDVSAFKHRMSTYDLFAAI